MQGDGFILVTWNFEKPASVAFEKLLARNDATTICIEGCRKAQELRSDGTVGWGGSPNENGESTLDAMVMDGTTQRVGCVGALSNIRDAIGVAHAVMTQTKHSFLVGKDATEFAIKMGFLKEDISSDESRFEYQKWIKNGQKPNFWNNKKSDGIANDKTVHHDTIGVLAVDIYGDVAAATSTNGAKFRIPGRIGDSPIPGSGCYADSKIGCAAATGDGDVLLRFLPSFNALEFLRDGFSPQESAQMALWKIIQKEKDFSGAIVVLSVDGMHGAASYNFSDFSYYFASIKTQELVKIKITPFI